MVPTPPPWCTTTQFFKNGPVWIRHLSSIPVVHFVLIRSKTALYQQQQMYISYMKLVMIGYEEYLVWEEGTLNFPLINSS